MRRFIFIVGFLLSSLALASSGGTIRGGGYAVVDASGTYLLDFYENGVTRLTPFWSSTARAISDDLMLPTELGRAHGFDTWQLQRRIQTVGLRDPILAMALLKTIGSMTWEWSSAKLQIVDADSAVTAKIEQLALRTGSNVLISQQLWNQLPPDQRVALFIHEALGALADAKLLSAPGIRAVTAKLFDEAYYLRYLNLVEDDLVYFPSLGELAKRSNLEQRNILFSWHDRFALLRPGSSATGQGVAPVAEYRFLPQLKIIEQNQQASLVKVDRANLQNVIQQLRAGLGSSATVTPLSIEAGYQTIEASIDHDLQQGLLEPRYLWTTAYQVRSVIKLGAQPSKAAKQQLKELILWLSSFEAILK